MKKIFLFIILFIATHKMMMAQNVGIGTITPQARLHVADSSVLFSANGHALPSTIGNPPVQGAGRRMMWYPDKVAFRVGATSGSSWDKDEIGRYSFASGDDTRASGSFSTAMGAGSVASGNYSTAMGAGTVASNIVSTAMGANSNASGYASTAMGQSTNATGDYSTAIGLSSDAGGEASTAIGWATTASGNYSTAMGYNTTAGGDYSTAMGINTLASADYSTAMGGGTLASGAYSTAMGLNTTASGNFSTAIGSNVSTNNHEGAFIIGDHSTATVLNSANTNNFRARFAGGYKLYTSANLATGCTLFAGDNAWTTGSSIYTKENVATVNGEDFLQKISRFNLTSWNYKTQDPKTFRHYGPMAQDFFAAFGKDSYGTIGCDTLINQQDFLGVNLIAIQALEKRTQKIEQLEKENTELRNMLLQLRKEIDEHKFKK